MHITFKVSQIDDKNIYTPLFSIDAQSFKEVTNIDFFKDELIKYQSYLKKSFDKKEFYILDEVHAKFDACLDFNYGVYIKNHKIQIPLTLFFIYTPAQLEDIANHIFLELFEKWQFFFNEVSKSYKIQG